MPEHCDVPRPIPGFSLECQQDHRDEPSPEGVQGPMKYQRLATFAAWLLIAWSCRSDRGPTAPGSSVVQTEVRLTDAPPADASVRSVNVYIEHIDASPTTDTTGGADSQPWITLVAPHQRYDLLTLQNGTTELLGTAQLSPAEFRAIRVVLDTDSSGIVHSDGTPAIVHWGATGSISISVLVEAPVQISGQSAHILLDFNVANSFVRDPQDPNAFIFLPWIRAVRSGS